MSITKLTITNFSKQFLINSRVINIIMIVVIVIISLTNSFAIVLIMLIIIIVPSRTTGVYYQNIPDDDTSLRQRG